MPFTSDKAERAEAKTACVNVHGLEVDGHVLSVAEACTLHVAGFGPSTTEKDIYDLFRQHGAVTSCIIPSDHPGEGESTNTSLRKERFALVTMAIHEAEEAKNNVHDQELDGHVLNVRPANKKNRVSGMSGGTLAAAVLAAGTVGTLVAFHRKEQLNPHGSGKVTLHVGGIGPESTDKDIRELFARHGTVVECIISFSDEEGGLDTGERYALVTMPTNEAESACYDINGMELNGRRLRVQDSNTASAGTGTARLNLTDNASSVYDNSYYDHTDYYGRTPHGSHGGEEADALGNKAAPGGIGSSIAIAPLLLFKSFRKTKENSQDKGNNYPLTHNTKQSLDEGLTGVINNIDSLTEKKERRNLVIDPPGAFHLGSHHYTSNGIRYFSPLCELCIAARADADGVVALKAIDENDVDGEDDGYGQQVTLSGRMIGNESAMIGNDLSFNLEAAKNFTDFNMTDLGRIHSSMHVRHCKSKTCVICARNNDVYFVKSRKWEDKCVPVSTSPQKREAML